MTDFSPHIFKIQRYSIHDGPGIRTTLFFQGCPLGCLWCHNPESQAMPGKIARNPGAEGLEDALVERLMAEVEKDLIFYDDSGGGVTFSGGEPLCQAPLVMKLAAACREKEIHTCLDTSGAVSRQVMGAAARAVDLVLYDIKAVDPALHKRLTGKDPEMILANLERLGREGRPVHLRFPLIPGATDSEENLAGVADFLMNRTDYRTIHILPFHHTARGKYEALGMADAMAETLPPKPETVEATARRFRALGFETFIGG